MAIKDFKKVSSADENTAKLQDRLDEFFSQFKANPLLDGVLLSNVQLGTTATNVAHKLGRPYIGWIIVDKNSQSDVWAINNDLSALYVRLQASAPTTAKIWVF